MRWTPRSIKKSYLTSLAAARGARLWFAWYPVVTIRREPTDQEVDNLKAAGLPTWRPAKRVWLERVIVRTTLNGDHWYYLPAEWTLEDVMKIRL